MLDSNAVLENFKSKYSSNTPEDMSIGEYLELCKENTMAYASSAERMLKAIGEPEIVDTSKDPRLSRIFNNRRMPMYESFKDFYGMETAIEKIVKFFTHAAQGLEERKQILYLLGPVGGGKSSLAEHLKSLMEKESIYILCYKRDDIVEECPYFVSPLCLFNKTDDGEMLQESFGIHPRYLNSVEGPWVLKRLQESSGDLSNFIVRKVKPDMGNQIAIAKTEPGDENNQDISALVGKVDIRKLKQFSQNDADSYSYSGSLCRANQGLMEFVEMFKAPIKVLHPLLTATQEGNYNGTESIPSIPFNGTVIAHSNESEWTTFKDNKNNEAFLDRVVIIKVPYCLRITDEISIYHKFITGSSLAEASCAPHTLSMLAKFMILTRLHGTNHSDMDTKLHVYDGENMKDKDPKAKPIQEYRDDAGFDEGMNGWSTRQAFKILAQVFNFDIEEQAANPVHLLYILQQAIQEGQFGDDKTAEYNNILKNTLQQDYLEEIKKIIQTAYLESYSEYGQNIYDRYIKYADHWIAENEYRDNETGVVYSRGDLEEELSKTERPAGISNPKDFRHEIVNLDLRYRADHNGESSPWNEFAKIREVIEKRMFSATEDLLPIISYGAKSNTEDDKKHEQFIERMCENGYTEKQTQLLVEWYIRVSKAS